MRNTEWEAVCNQLGSTLIYSWVIFTLSESTRSLPCVSLCVTLPTLLVCICVPGVLTWKCPVGSSSHHRTTPPHPLHSCPTLSIRLSFSKSSFQEFKNEASSPPGGQKKSRTLTSHMEKWTHSWQHSTRLADRSGQESLSHKTAHPPTLQMSQGWRGSPRRKRVTFWPLKSEGLLKAGQHSTMFLTD